MVLNVLLELVLKFDDFYLKWWIMESLICDREGLM